VPYGPGLTILDYNLGILYILAVSSLSTYGILLAGLKISPPIIRIIGNKLGEFQEILKLSKFEAKHINNKYGRSTTSRLVYKNNNSTMSAQGLTFYISYLTTVLFLYVSEKGLICLSLMIENIKTRL
jgi:hypothetical protein